MTSDSTVSTTPWGYHALGAALLVLPAGLVIRLTWEQTLLTWRNGQQMIGFSLGHTHPLIFLVAPVALVVAVILAVGRLLRIKRKHHRVDRAAVGHIAVALLLTATVFVPTQFWNRIAAIRSIGGPFAAEFLIGAAGSGDIETVKTMLNRGTPVGARDDFGTTAMHSAAAGNQVRVLETLIAAGAPIDGLNSWGDSPLESAVSSKASLAARFLESHGAHRVIGTDAQRNQAAMAAIQAGERRSHGAPAR